MTANQEVLLISRPTEHPSHDNFKFQSKETPKLEHEGEILVKVLYLSVDPYMRPKMTNAKSYTAMYQLNKPFEGTGIAQVVESKNNSFKEKDFVTGNLRWNKTEKYSQEEIKNFSLRVFKPELELSDYLHILGLTGLTAYIGLLEIGKPKEGDVVVVSGAAGATGSVVGQIAKIKGYKVIGIAGSDEKVKLIKEEFGFDDGINYKKDDIQKKLEEFAPKGVNLYFDNVGGSTLDALLLSMASHGKIVCCGSISGYNTNPEPIYNTFKIVSSRLTIQGFIMSEHAHVIPQAMSDITKWAKEGKIKSQKSISEGLESIVDAFKGLFEGKNTGKQMVHIGDPL